MIKEVKTEDTVYEYYCDICGKEQHDDRWNYGGFMSADEHLKVCIMCGKEVCEKCRDTIPDYYYDSDIICNNCSTKYSSIIDEITRTKGEASTKIQKLRKELFAQRQVLK